MLLGVAASCDNTRAALKNDGGSGGAGTGAGGGGAGASGGAGGGSGGAGGAAVDAGGGDAGVAPSCDDLGPEPTIPTACATVMATKAVATGALLADEATLDTTAVQAAIDACPAGQAVKLAVNGANNALLSGALFLRAGVTLWVDAGVTLYESRNPRDFDARAGQCGGNGTGNASCNALVNARGVANAGVVGAGTLDGRGGEVVMGGTSTWWQLETADAGSLAAPRLIQVSGSQNFTLYLINLHNAPKFHVSIESTNGFKVWGIEINTPPTAPNTDGIDPAASTNGVIAYNKITTGDDDIAIKGSGPPIVDNILIAHNHFGRGHGMSIGSETYGGVQNVTVCDLSIDNAQNGLRIKSDSSRGGLVRNISYTDVCMRRVTNPLVFDPYYSSATGTLIPNYQNISVNNVHVLGGGTVTVEGYDDTHPLTLALSNVVFDTAPIITAAAANITVGPDPVSIGMALAATGLTVSGAATGTTPPRDCTNAWVTF